MYIEIRSCRTENNICLIGGLQKHCNQIFMNKTKDSCVKKFITTCHTLSPFNVSESESEVAQSCPTLCDPMDCSPPGSSVHRIHQARILEWVAISFSRVSSPPRDRTQVSRIAGRYFNLWATREALPFNVKEAWIPTWGRWFLGTLVHSLLGLLAFWKSHYSLSWFPLS